MAVPPAVALLPAPPVALLLPVSTLAVIAFVVTSLKVRVEVALPAVVAPLPPMAVFQGKCAAAGCPTHSVGQGAGGSDPAAAAGLAVAVVPYAAPPALAKLLE